MPATTRSAIAVTVLLSAFASATSVANAADDAKGIVCPPNKPYCIQKPALTQEDIDVLEGRAAVKIDAAEEARKTQLRAAVAYRDPVSINLCPPPYYVMTDWNGCRPSHWR